MPALDAPQLSAGHNGEIPQLSGRRKHHPVWHDDQRANDALVNAHSVVAHPAEPQCLDGHTIKRTAWNRAWAKRSAILYSGVLVEDSVDSGFGYANVVHQYGTLR